MHDLLEGKGATKLTLTGMPHASGTCDAVDACDAIGSPQFRLRARWCNCICVRAPYLRVSQCESPMHVHLSSAYRHVVFMYVMHASLHLVWRPRWEASFAAGKWSIDCWAWRLPCIAVMHALSIQMLPAKGIDGLFSVLSATIVSPLFCLCSLGWTLGRELHLLACQQKSFKVDGHGPTG